MGHGHHHHQKPPKTLKDASDSSYCNILSHEYRGTKFTNPILAGIDAIKETAFIFLLLKFLFSYFHLSFVQQEILIGLLLLGWMFWKTGQTAWIAWSRLERSHRLLEQEKWEIDHNPERTENQLREMYKAKGFEGKQLEDIVELLSTDPHRLLKVMIEEKFGIPLEVHEHPLNQSLGTFLGILITSLILFGLNQFSLNWTVYLAGCLIIGFSGYFSAFYEENKTISAVIWNLSLAIFSLGIIKFIMDFLQLEGWVS
ncbi:MAG: VIT1/CCC1 transporter family protein [Parachlamydiaceae bacterium]|nr:VIT1/CCC1 transporter family protein [Parachlamydiaceae bacterium]